MDDKKEPKSDEQEKKIPVFTVLKNNGILKNIFVIDDPPSITEPKSIEFVENGNQSVQENEEILLVGRHPDCNITLEHPSISRFHLRIHSKPILQKLSVIDLSSVHGTWVSGKKIEPGVRVELSEGDTMRLGGSSRVYTLHWVPLSRAYDLENSFVSPFDVPVEEKEEEETYQDENCLFVVESNQIQPLCNDLEGMDWLFSDNSELSLKNVIPSAPPLPEYMSFSSFSIEEEVRNKSPSKKDSEQSEISSLLPVGVTESVNSLLPVGVVVLETENQQFDKENQNPKTHVVSEVLSENIKPDSPTRWSDQKSNLAENLKPSFSDEELENQCLARKNHEQREISSPSYQPLMTEIVNSCFPCGIVISTIKDQQFEKENQTSQPLFASEGLPGRENPESPLIRSEQKPNLPVNFNSSLSDEEKGHPVAEILAVIEKRSPLRKDHEKSEIPKLWSGAVATESVNSSLPGGNVLSEIENQQFDRENQISQAPFSIGVSQRENPESPPIRSEQKSNLPSIWSRRGKPATVVQIQTGRSRGKSTGANNNIDAKVEALLQKDIENKLISKALFAGLDGYEEESFTPDKENFTPNTLLLRSMKKMGKIEEIKHSKSCRSSSLKNAVNPNIQPEEDILAFSDKENQTPKVLQEQKSVKPASRSQVRMEPEVVVMKSRAERVPFQRLLVNPTGKSKSEASVLSSTTRSSNSVNYARTIEKVTNPSCNNSIGGEKRKWNMVVDSTCLLNKKSRKALQLLQGLKGTQLIIPRIVIRELDCMKRRGSLFRRTIEVSSALEWIEECMVNTKWWIHVQSSVEEGRPIAPTPPASPQSQFSEGSRGFPGGTASSVPFSAYGSLLEIVSPTAEDHILECALLFKRPKKDGQLVLLTDDVTLKIKAMAEGLVCETAEDFRESLVNPFSERFLWADSSPRGPTWSCVDDVVLREKYNRCPLKKPSKLGESAKGLKLILLHNSHYGKISSVS